MFRYDRAAVAAARGVGRHTLANHASLGMVDMGSLASVSRYCSRAQEVEDLLAEVLELLRGEMVRQRHARGAVRWRYVKLAKKVELELGRRPRTSPDHLSK